MAEHILKSELIIDRPRSDVFDFFADASNLERITPAELSFHISTPQPIEMREGTLIDYRLRLNGLPMSWQTLISKWDPPNEFIDEQISGPYKQWIHRHKFTELGPDKTLIEDEVRYRLPFEPFGDLAHFVVKGQLTKIFGHRQKVVAEYFQGTGAASNIDVGDK